MIVQKAKPSHFQEIVNIYNWAVENTTATFDTEIKDLNNYSSFLESFIKFPLLVYLEGSVVIGWACLKPYSDRSAYDDTVELSIYIHPDHHGKKIGSILMERLLSEAKGLDLHTILSRVTSESIPSVKLHEKFNFFLVGTMREVGFKFNRRVDVHFMQKVLK